MGKTHQQTPLPQLTPFMVGKIRQVAFITKDLQASMTHFAEKFGIGPWYYEPAVAVKGCHYRGQIVDITLVAGIANSGAMQFEFIEQTNDAPSVYQEFLSKYPLQAQVQHLCVWVDDVTASQNEALQHGYDIVQTSSSALGRLAYLCHPDFPDICLELADITPIRKNIYTAIEQAAVGWDGSDPIRKGFPGL